MTILPMRANTPSQQLPTALLPPANMNRLELLQNQNHRMANLCSLRLWKAKTLSVSKRTNAIDKHLVIEVDTPLELVYTLIVN